MEGGSHCKIFVCLSYMTRPEELSSEVGLFRAARATQVKLSFLIPLFTSSGGIKREWTGVPRRHHPPGMSQERCVCVRTTGGFLEEIRSEVRQPSDDTGSVRRSKYSGEPFNIQNSGSNQRFLSRRSSARQPCCDHEQWGSFQSHPERIPRLRADISRLQVEVEV